MPRWVLISIVAVICLTCSLGDRVHAQSHAGFTPVGCSQGYDGSLTCACSKAAVDQGHCCRTNPHPSCRMDCAACTESNFPTCCDPMIRGYLCTCMGPKKMETGALSYYLVATTYLPPGNMSTEQYLSGTTLGSQTQVQITTAGGVVAQITTPASQSSAGYLYGGITGEAFQFTMNAASGVQLTSTADLADHLHDKFWLWTNVDMSVTVQDNQYSASLQPSAGGTINVVDVTVADLIGIDTLPKYKADMLAKLTKADKEAILRTNPFLASLDGRIVARPNLDSKRFTFLNQHYEVMGPDSDTDSPAGIALDTNSQTVHGAIQGYMDQVTASVGVGTNVSFITGASASIGAQFQYNYQKTKQSNSGKISDAQGLLESKTKCWHQGVDVYWDGAFGTFLFLPTDNGSADCNEDPDLAGVVTTKALAGGGATSKPASVMVTATMPGGVIWRTRSNARGAFRFFHLPANAARGVRIATERKSDSLDITRFVGLSGAFQATRAADGSLVVSLPQPDCHLTTSCVVHENQPPQYVLTCKTAADVYASSGVPANPHAPPLGELLGQKVTTQTALTTEYDMAVVACAPGTRNQCTRFSIEVPVVNWCHSPPPPPPRCPECGNRRCCNDPNGGPRHVCVPLSAQCPLDR